VFSGDGGRMVATIGTILAIAASCFSSTAMLGLLFGMAFIPLAGGWAPELRIFFIVFGIYAIRIAFLRPSFLQILAQKNNLAARDMRWWGGSVACFFVLGAIFFALTSNSDFGAQCAWDTLRGLLTLLLVAPVAIHSVRHQHNAKPLLLMIVIYVLAGSVWMYKAADLGSLETAAMGGRNQAWEVRTSSDNGDPNAVGLLYTVGAGFVFGILLFSRQWYLRGLAAAALVGACLQVAASGSRGGSIGLVAAILLSVFVGYRTVSQLVSRVAIGVIMLTTITLLLLPLLEISILPRWEKTWTDISGGDYASGTAGRTIIIKAYLSKLAASSFLGGGFNYDQIAQIRGWPCVAHNTWLQVLCDFGLIGFVCFLGIIFPAYRLAVLIVCKERQRPNFQVRPLEAGAAMALVGLFTATFALTSTFELIFWWPIGLAVGLWYNYKKGNHENCLIFKKFANNDRWS